MAAGPAVTGQAGTATGREPQRQWQEAVGTVAAAGVAAVASEAAAAAEEEAPREAAAGSQEAGAPGPDRRLKMTVMQRPMEKRMRNREIILKER